MEEVRRDVIGAKGDYGDRRMQTGVCTGKAVM